MNAYESYIAREWPRRLDEPAYMTAQQFVEWLWDNYEPTPEWQEIVVQALEARDAEIARKARQA